MKKFLTVLLALSVVFTYTVGTAFAAAPAGNEAVAKALGYVTSIHDSAKKLVSDNGDKKYDSSDWTVSAENWTLAYEDAYGALVDAVAKAAGDNAVSVINTVTGLSVDPGATDRDIKIALEDYLADTTTGTTYTADYASVALKAQLVEEKAEAVKKVEAIDTTIYSTTEYTKDTAKEKNADNADYYWSKYSYVSGTLLSKGEDLFIAKDVADSIIKGVMDGIDAVTAVDANKTGADASADVVNCHTNLNSLMNGHVQRNGDTNGNNVEDADETWTYTFVPTIVILTAAEEIADGASSAASIAAKKATIASNIAAFKASATYLNASANDKAAYDEYLAAYNTAQTYLAENVANHTVGGINSSDTNLIANVKKAAEKIEAAAEFKGMKNKDGSDKYDADKIDVNLKTILTALYSGTTTSVDLTDDALITYVTNAEKVNTKAVLAKKVDKDAMTYDSKAYYALEWKAVEATLDSYYAAVDAAIVASDLTDAKAALDKAIGKIDTSATVLGYYAASGKLNTAATSEFAKLKVYAQLLNTEQGTKDPLVFAITDILANTMDTTGADNTLVKFYIDKDARTAAEITALNSEVKALLGSSKTSSALKDEAKNVVAMIEALPAKANITVADKAAIEAAYDAYEALNPAYRVYVTNHSTLKTAIDTVMKAEKDEILKATKNFPSVYTVTIADKDAIQTVADMIDAYNDTEMYDISTKYTNASVTSLLNKIKSLEFDAVKAAVKAIPEADKIVAGDKDAIEAARAAYDDFLTNYGDSLTSSDVSTVAGYEKKIVEAEKVLAKALSEDMAKKIKEIESLKIVASSKLYKGKKIQVKWRIADGDASAITGYQVYKSTKANSGYKFMGKTKKLYMDNKKSLKKGTRYFYKVRAYIDVDGERYFSDWSNKANRIYKK